MKHHESKETLCPFYGCEEKQRIHCEGTEKTNKVHLVFGSRPEMIYYKQRFCDKNYRKCRLYAMLWRKYED